MGKLIRAITTDGAVLAAAVDTTDLAARAERIHESSATVTAAMGRLLSAACMMGAAMKNEGESITLRVAGGGPAGSLIAVADSLGNARISVGNPKADLPLNEKGKLDVGGVVGHEGLLSVIRDFGAGLEPQTGHAQLSTGEIGDDISYYLGASEQVPSVCAVGVLVNPDLTVAASGGYLLQLLPGADDDTIDRIEKNIAAMASVSALIREGKTPQEILTAALDGFEVEVIEEREIAYRCNCSRERVERVLVSLGAEELERLAAEQENTNVACHFCERSYDFSSAELRALLKSAQKKD